MLTITEPVTNAADVKAFLQNEMSIRQMRKVDSVLVALVETPYGWLTVRLDTVQIARDGSHFLLEDIDTFTCDECENEKLEIWACNATGAAYCEACHTCNDDCNS